MPARKRTVPKMPISPLKTAVASGLRLTLEPRRLL
jgi:hypothetical protein